jgi:hypothetical protein
MNVSRQFLRDFAYLANHYGWTPADIEDVKADTRASPGLVDYWTVLANAHRAGYEQTPQNGYIRLVDWCDSTGFPLDLASLGAQSAGRHGAEGGHQKTLQRRQP